jgi:hypothetical protein
MKALIVGMGIGQLYKTVLEELNFSTVTVDLSKPADYKSVGHALTEHQNFDGVFICTPNFTHESIARQVAEYTRVVFIEKPGVETAEKWQGLVNDFPKTRFYMVKNNQYRDNITSTDNETFAFYNAFGNSPIHRESKLIKINWINKNRIPNPGTWFTNKKQSYGGVTRDLLPHLLSLVAFLRPQTYFYKDRFKLLQFEKKQWHSLNDVPDTDYGTVDKNGVYDVDDYVRLDFELFDVKFEITADWRSDEEDDVSITFYNYDNIQKFQLGLCPESAYKNMIEAVFFRLDNEYWWDRQLELDLWIHRMVSYEN